jgi:hypothetical protein
MEWIALTSNIPVLATMLKNEDHGKMRIMRKYIDEGSQYCCHSCLQRLSHDDSFGGILNKNLVGA